jgi:hypothetical protein
LERATCSSKAHERKYAAGPVIETGKNDRADGGKPLVTVDTLIDPWGKPYKYDPEGKRNGGDVGDTWTVAPDGEAIGNWQRPERERRQAGKNPK